jgi:hypothetical protein
VGRVPIPGAQGHALEVGFPEVLGIIF